MLARPLPVRPARAVLPATEAAVPPPPPPPPSTPPPAVPAATGLVICAPLVCGVPTLRMRRDPDKRRYVRARFHENCTGIVAVTLCLERQRTVAVPLTSVQLRGTSLLLDVTDILTRHVMPSGIFDLELCVFHCGGTRIDRAFCRLNFRARVGPKHRKPTTGPRLALKNKVPPSTCLRVAMLMMGYACTQWGDAWEWLTGSCAWWRAADEVDTQRLTPRVSW